MLSWVRYSVTVYLGLLIAGSIASSVPSNRAAPSTSPRASYRTAAPVSDPKLNPVLTEADEAVGYRGARITWQNTAQADQGR